MYRCIDVYICSYACVSVYACVCVCVCVCARARVRACVYTYRYDGPAWRLSVLVYDANTKSMRKYLDGQLLYDTSTTGVPRAPELPRNLLLKSALK